MSSDKQTIFVTSLKKAKHKKAQNLICQSCSRLDKLHSESGRIRARLYTCYACLCAQARLREALAENAKEAERESKRENERAENERKTKRVAALRDAYCKLYPDSKLALNIKE
jgi:hypothetical protein